MAKVDFYFDFLSPYSYLATFRLARLRNEFGAEFAFHVILPTLHGHAQLVAHMPHEL